MSYSYVVTAQKPTSVSRAITGNFTSPTEVNLIISKTTRLEIHTLTPDGLQPFLDIGIYGRISTLELFRPKNEEKDLLLIVTERYKFCVLSYDSRTGEIVTKANGDLQDRISKPAENAQIGIIDPNCRAIGLHIHTGLFKIIPINELGVFSESFNLRMEELSVIDVQFLYGRDEPTIIVLYQDQKEARHIITYKISIDGKQLIKDNLRINTVEAAASKIIPVPLPYGGALIVGETSIVYVDNDNRQISISMDATSITTFGIVDPDGSRYLLGDLRGELYILLLNHDESSQIVGLKLEKLGETSIPNTIAYLDNGVVFIGSLYGDSQLIKLLTDKSDESGSYIEFLDSFVNLGPIVDFTVVDLERQGQGQVVTCSGAYKDGSLRIIRNGIGINEQASIELPGVKGIWSLKGENVNFHKYLVVSFVGQTRILAIQDDEMGESEIAGFDSSTQTLFCSNVTDNQILQVTEKEIRLISSKTLELTTQWKTKENELINVVSVNQTQIVLSIGSGNLVYLQIEEGSKIKEVKRKTMEHEISCLDIHPLTYNNDNQSVAEFCAVGLWTDFSIRILHLPSLEEVTKELLGGEFLPRSILFASFENIQYLLCGLGDGNLFSFKFAHETRALHDRKKVSLGSQPILLNIFESKDAKNIFAASDRPTVIYSNNKKLLFSNVNLKDASYMCPFNAETFPNSLAIIGNDCLTIGTIDDIQKLHIRTIPLHEMPRRISYQESTNTFLLLTVNFQTDETETGFIRLFDDQSFDVLDSYRLNEAEIGCSCCTIEFVNPENNQKHNYFIVGTAINEPGVALSSRGRLLVIQVVKKKLQIVHSTNIDGCAFALAPIRGNLLAAVNGNIILYKWEHNTLEESLRCQIKLLNLYLAVRNNYAAVGDLMQSITLLQVNEEERDLLEEVARDYTPNWMSAIEILSDDFLIGAENNFNLFTLRKNTESPIEEERSKLLCFGEYHLGEFVNKFQHGSLVMCPTDNKPIQTLLYGSVAGSLGIIASISEQDYLFFERVQENINKVIKGVGGLNHSEWRSFRNEQKQAPARAFIDGDLIESFLDLKPEKMAEVVDGLDITVEALCRRIEDLAQAIH